MSPKLYSYLKITRLLIIVAGLIIGTDSCAQQLPPGGVTKLSRPEKKNEETITQKTKGDSKLSIITGLGLANYLGDLTEHNRIYSQSGFAFSAGASYAFATKFSAKLNFGIQQVKAADSKNTGAQYKARNLSFKSQVIDMTVALDYDLISIKKHGFSPYVSAGAGVMFFNPTAENASGKQKLRELGTEGQGLAGYPGLYNKATFAIPLGFGVKIAASKKVLLHLDFCYRITGTDYLDDVSTAGYPDKALLDAKNPIIATFTWRGNEVGGETYPNNLKSPRGNPSNKDGYYTTQLKLEFKL